MIFQIIEAIKIFLNSRPFSIIPIVRSSKIIFCRIEVKLSIRFNWKRHIDVGGENRIEKTLMTEWSKRSLHTMLLSPTSHWGDSMSHGRFQILFQESQIFDPRKTEIFVLKSFLICLLVCLFWIHYQVNKINVNSASRNGRNQSAFVCSIMCMLILFAKDIYFQLVKH